jgi:hypothetical protein
MELFSDFSSAFSTDSEIEVLLDGVRLDIPAQVSTVAGIRFYIEVIALERHRVLCSMRVDDMELELNSPMFAPCPISRVEAETIDLEQVPIQLIGTALSHVAVAQSHLMSSITLVLINTGDRARQIWWNLACKLKQPLVSSNEMPESVRRPANGCASVRQIRKWQLQQLATIMREVDEASWSQDPIALSDALEKRVVPWAAGLERTLDLCHKTLQTGPLPSTD